MGLGWYRNGRRKGAEVVIRDRYKGRSLKASNLELRNGLNVPLTAVNVNSFDKKTPSSMLDLTKF